MLNTTIATCSLLPETISGHPVLGHHTARGGLMMGTHHTSKTVSGYSMRGHHTALGCLKISAVWTPHTACGCLNTARGCLKISTLGTPHISEAFLGYLM